VRAVRRETTARARRDRELALVNKEADNGQRLGFLRDEGAGRLLGLENEVQNDDEQDGYAGIDGWVP
jgi:hypothetical protein